MKNEQYNLLIIDENQDQVDDFYRFIENIVKDGQINAELKVFDLMSLAEDDDLIDYIIEHEIDAVGIDYKLKENANAFANNGDVYMNLILDNFEGFPTFIITNNAEDSRAMNADPFKVIPKSIVNYDTENQVQMVEAKALVEKVVESIEKYYQNIQAYEDELFELIQKQESGANLSEEELQRVVYLDDKLENSISKRQKIPAEWKSPANIENIAALVANSEDILNQLKQINNG